MDRVGHFLGSREQVVHATRQHPIVLAKPLTLWVAAMTFLTLAGTLVLARTAAPIAERILAALALAATGFTAVRLLQWWATRYVFTQERVMLLSGLLSIRVTSVPLAKVNDTTFSKSFWGRIFGFGHLVLESAGERAGLSQLLFLPKPEEVYRLLTSLLSEPYRREQNGSRARWPGVRAASEDDTGPLPRFG